MSDDIEIFDMEIEEGVGEQPYMIYFDYAASNAEFTVIDVHNTIDGRCISESVWEPQTDKIIEKLEALKAQYPTEWELAHGKP